MLVNAMRGLATEFGLTVPKGIGKSPPEGAKLYR